METLNPPMRKHYNLFIYLIVIFCLPTILLLYILFGIFTIPLSIYFYRNHKDQIHNHLEQQYKIAKQFVSQFKVFNPIAQQFVGQFKIHSLLPLVLVQTTITAIQKFISENKYAKNVIEFTQPLLTKVQDSFYYCVKFLKQNKLTILVEKQILNFVTHSDKLHVIGYAMLNATGHTITQLEREKEPYRFRIQLHQYAITQFWKTKHLKGKKILEVECQDANGLEYIAKTYEPEIFWGVDSQEDQIQQNNNRIQNQKNIKFDTVQPLNIGGLCNVKTFDIILALELQQKQIFHNIDLKSYIGVASTLLNDEGVFIIGDYGSQDQMQMFQNIISTTGMIIVEKCDFTVGVTQAMKLQAETIKKINEKGNINIVQRYLLKYFIKPNEQQLQKFKNRDLIYMVYILKKAQL